MSSRLLFLLEVAAAVIGLALVVAGVAFWSVPAALIVAGVALVAGAYAIRYLEVSQSETA